MKKLFYIVLLSLISFQIYGQNKDSYDLKWGFNGDYSYSGTTNSISIGPSLFLIKDINFENQYWYNFNLNGGLWWNNESKSGFVSSESFYFGNLPGITFAVSSQQYFNVESASEKGVTDIRASAEIIFAYFGFIGYRYQHPLIAKNEAIHISRHSLIVRIPIPIKSF